MMEYRMMPEAQSFKMARREEGENRSSERNFTSDIPRRTIDEAPTNYRHHQRASQLFNQ
jgi:hypothetical protein